MINVVKESGLTIISKKTKGDSVGVGVMVNVGSNQETNRLSGISHFLEHMMFETKNRDAIKLTSEIEKIGGIFNAYTSNDRTIYFGKVPKKYFNILVDVLSDMIKNPKFDPKKLAKEKNVVLAEAKMYYDNPMAYQFLLMNKTLFKKHPVKNPILGNPNAIKKMSREDLVNYHKKYYTKDNLVVCAVGNFDNINRIKECFKDVRKGKVKINSYNEKIQNNNRILTNKRKIQHSYIGMGFHAANRTSKESYAFDVLGTVLGCGLSSKLGIEIREKRGLVYQIGAEYSAGKDFGSLIIYLSSDKKNIELVKKLILEEVNKLKKISKKDLYEAKKSIEGRFLLEYEDNLKLVDLLAKWYFLKDVKTAMDYVKNIRKVNRNDVKNIIKKYMKNYSFVAIKGE